MSMGYFFDNIFDFSSQSILFYIFSKISKTYNLDLKFLKLFLDKTIFTFDKSQQLNTKIVYLIILIA